MILNKIGGEKVKSHIPGAVAKLRSVISGVPLAISVEEIVSELKENGVKVTETKRMFSKKGGEKSESLSTLLHFEEILQKKVLMGMFSYPEREYIFCHILDASSVSVWVMLQDNVKERKGARCGVNHAYGK